MRACANIFVVGLLLCPISAWAILKPPLLYREISIGCQKEAICAVPCSTKTVIRKASINIECSIALDNVLDDICRRYASFRSFSFSYYAIVDFSRDASSRISNIASDDRKNSVACGIWNKNHIIPIIPTIRCIIYVSFFVVRDIQGRIFTGIKIQNANQQRRPVLQLSIKLHHRGSDPSTLLLIHFLQLPPENPIRREGGNSSEQRESPRSSQYPDSYGLAACAVAFVGITSLLIGCYCRCDGISLLLIFAGTVLMVTGLGSVIGFEIIKPM